MVSRVGDTSLKRAVFLDRDGVLVQTNVVNGKPVAVRSLAEMVLLGGAKEAVKKLKKQGFVTIIVTNQPEIARGRLDPEEHRRMTEWLVEALDVDLVETCPHDDKDNCDCRKPKPGMLRNAAKKLDLSLTNSYMIGDRWRDVVAGKAAGVRTILIDCSYDEQAPVGTDADADLVVDRIGAAAEAIVRGDV